MRGEAMSYQQEIQTLIEKYTRDSAYQELHWEGTMAQYLELVGQSPKILRNAFQRIYDMIISYGIEEYT
jgi:serine protein kinase